MSRIMFEIIRDASSFLDPREGFAEKTEQFQVRIDPLTGRSGHLSRFGVVRPPLLPLGSYEEPETRARCPFCPEQRDKVTPRFVSRILPEGRLSKGEAMTIPNLNPYDVHSAVTIMTHEHVVPLEKMTDEVVRDAFSLGIDFLKYVKRADPAVSYQLIAWNYMPPSGGGIVHPHQQCSATRNPGNLYLDELNASRRFYDSYGVDYWAEYIDEEIKRGERYIGAIGTSRWLASFVSRGILGDVTCVFPDVFDLDDFRAENIGDLAAGLRKLFAYYRDSRISSFNAVLFVGPPDQEYFPCHFRIVPRTFLNARDFAPDTNFFHMLLDEPVSMVLPEELCNVLRSHFAS